MVRAVDLPNRQSIRLRGHDYSVDGVYFITVCSHERQNMFGAVASGRMMPNEYGRQIEKTWSYISNRYEYIREDRFVIMPNHIHGIWILGNGFDITDDGKPEKNRKPIGRLVGAFKTVSTKYINDMRGTPGAKLWQRGYYDRVIRNQDELNAIRRYIEQNPKNWATDENNIG